MDIGIVGAGNWGHRVIDEYIDLKNDGTIDDVYICDKNKDLLKNYKDYKTNDDYKNFLKDDDVDAVHICVPNKFHYDVVKYAMDNNKHVLVEKPMTTTSSDAYNLVELSAENGLILQVGHIYRFANVIKRLKEYMNKNYFGDIKYLTFKWTAMFTPSSDTDIIWDLIPHILDMIHFLTGEWPEGSHIFRKEKQSAFLNLDYGNFFVNVELSWITPERKREMIIIGSDRSAKVECVKQQIQIFENGSEVELRISCNNTIKDEALNFISSIKNKKMQYNSHIIGARTVDAIERIMKNEYQ